MRARLDGDQHEVRERDDGPDRVGDRRRRVDDGIGASDDTTSPSPKPSQTEASDPSAILLPKGTLENPYVGFPSRSAAQAVLWSKSGVATVLRDVGGRGTSNRRTRRIGRPARVGKVPEKSL